MQHLNGRGDGLTDFSLLIGALSDVQGWWEKDSFTNIICCSTQTNTDDEASSFSRRFVADPSNPNLVEPRSCEVILEGVQPAGPEHGRLAR